MLYYIYEIKNGNNNTNITISYKPVLSRLVTAQCVIFSLQKEF
jgi:hypothetical protein